jgi:hypothetical protein
MTEHRNVVSIRNYKGKRRLKWVKGTFFTPIGLLIWSFLLICTLGLLIYPESKSVPTFDYQRAKADLMEYNPDPLAPKL